MDLPAIIAQINDLPSTFRPAGNPYAQLIASKAAALALFTDGADATMAQVQGFGSAVDGWIDVYGLLFGVPRNDGEGNIPYAARIVETVLAWVATGPAIRRWLDLFAPGGTTAENPSGLGYSITLPAYMTPAQVAAFLVSLGRIRPDGVPFTVTQSGLGLYLDAEAFLGKGTDIGSYLPRGTGPAALGLNATTCSAQPILPTLLMTDPSLNPGLVGTSQ